VAFFAAAIVLDDYCEIDDREKKHCASPASRAEIISVLFSVNQSVVSFFHFSVSVKLTERVSAVYFDSMVSRFNDAPVRFLLTQLFSISVVIRIDMSGRISYFLTVNRTQHHAYDPTRSTI
jgi:hypothetical protein